MKIGDKVTLSDFGRERYYNDGDNPHMDVGVIEGNDGSEDDVDDLPWRVRWSNDYLNSYDSRDLVPTVHANTLTPGQPYTSANGNKWECIYTRGDKAWLVSVYDGKIEGAAYAFDLDGTASWVGVMARDDYSIVFEPVRETVTCGVAFDKGRIWSGMPGPDNRKAKITLETVNGEPDWTTAKVEAAR